MPGNDNEFIRKTIESLKTVAKDNAIRMPGNDEGFQVVICPNEIKKATGRQRIGGSVLEKYKQSFENAGFIPKASENKCLNIFVPPMLAKKEEFNLSEISERIDILEEIETSKK